jgi:chitinase
LHDSPIRLWQNPAELSTFFEGSFNSYAPLVDTSIIEHVTWVAPRLYNDPVPLKNNVSKYVTSLSAGKRLEWDGREIEIKVPPSKLVLGHPATAEAASARDLAVWQKDPEALVELYRSTPDLLATKGVMAWSIGHDYASGWKWVKAVKKIWSE